MRESSALVWIYYFSRELKVERNGEFKEEENNILVATQAKDQGFPSSATVKNLPANTGGARDAGSGRSPGEVNGNPLQYSCLENPMDRGAWWTTVHRIAKNGMTEWLSKHRETKGQQSL